MEPLNLRPLSMLLCFQTKKFNNNFRVIVDLLVINENLFDRTSNRFTL